MVILTYIYVVGSVRKDYLKGVVFRKEDVLSIEERDFQGVKIVVLRNFL